ncbi:MAG TPA: DUF4236 domain-containing protein [Ktedonobacterales bacterium]|jgi:hypothetical protein|nr:DUF4236 domain-containing protein [Ktedonobacterales bacterium]
MRIRAVGDETFTDVTGMDEGGGKMGWYLRKSVRVGPVRFNLSKRGVGVSTGVKGLRVGAGPNGPYVAGGRGGLYFRQRLGGRPRSGGSSAHRAPMPQTAFGAASDPSPATSSAQQTGEQIFTPHVYRGWVLLALVGAFVLSWIMIGASGSGGDSSGQATNPVLIALANIGTFVFLADFVAVAVLDWRGFTTLNGHVRWARLSRSARFWLVVAYVFCFEIMLGIYLAIAGRDWLKARQANRLSEPLGRQRHIAELEAQLGMMPRTEGACRACQKPLQVGADWCAYCGAPVIERPRVCPMCAATALPDARFCPQCRTPLPPSTPPSSGTLELGNV